MWQQIFLIFVGLSSGIIIAGGVVGLMIGLSIVPRYAGITHTADHMLLYEDMTFLGIVLGNLFCLFQPSLPLGNIFLILYGIFSGIFLGSWILALAEVADVFPVFCRRIHLTRGLPVIIIAIAAGTPAAAAAARACVGFHLGFRHYAVGKRRDRRGNKHYKYHYNRCKPFQNKTPFPQISFC